MFDIFFKSKKASGPINLSYIESLKPCSNRLKNYVSHYKDFDGSLTDFFKLDKLTHADKLWVAFRLLNRKQTVECACQFAESVLNIYESRYPNDDRPRKVILAVRSGDRNAAAYAAYAADDADDAADAAAYAAYAAAADDAYAAAAYAAAKRANSASLRSNGPNLESAQLEIILKVYNS